jgi:hypothetical protein
MTETNYRLRPRPRIIRLGNGPRLSHVPKLVEDL